MPKGDAVPAIRHRDGSWTFQGVRVFAVVKKGANGGSHEVDREWLEEAVARGKTRKLADGYEAPAHINHTSRGATMGIGTFVPRSVEEIEYQGKMIPTMLVDLKVKKPWIGDAIAKGDLPFRSVEIPEDGTPEVASLALFDDRVPFFRYGALSAESITDEAAEPTAAFSFGAKARPLVAFSASGRTRTLLFEMKGEKFEKKDEDPDEKGDDDGGDDQGAGEDEGGDGFPPKETDENEDQGEGPPAAEKGSEGAGGLAKKVDAMLAWLQRIGEKILGGNDPDNAPATPVEMEAKDETEETTVTTKPGNTKVELPADVVEKLKRFDALESKFTEFEARNAQSTAAAQAKATADGIYEAAKKKLVGVNLSTQDDTDLREFAALGQAHVDRAVRIFQSRTVRDGPETLEEALQQGGAGASGDPAEVAEFAAKGPRALETARSLQKAWEANRKIGIGCTLKEFIDANLKSKLVVEGVGEPR